MATGIERLERNLDKLEKFFKKRKPTSIRESLVVSDRESVRHSSLVEPFDLDQQTFPSPSFIRPTSTRMLARDESGPSARHSRRAQSLPESSPTPERRVSDETPPSQYSTIIDQFPKIPQRSSSLRQSSFTRLSIRPLSGAASLAELLNYSVPEEISMSTNTLLGSLGSSFGPRYRADSAQPTERRGSRFSQEVVAVAPSDRVYTPPPSAREENFPASVQSHKKSNSLPHSSLIGNPTPEPSPKLIPSLAEIDLNETVKSTDVKATRPKSLDNEANGTPKITMASLRKTLSDSTLAASALGKGDDTLTEPSLKDFLTLSDDDIADDLTDGMADHDIMTPEKPIRLHEPTNPPSCSLPPDPPQPATPQKDFGNNSPVSVEYIPSPAPPTPAPVPLPQASRTPATVAAFEAARIAARYKFDLVYVVNLWPSNTGCSLPRALSTKSSASSLSTPTAFGPSPTTPINSLRSLQELHKCLEGQGSIANIKPPGGMNGRILAAYGLPSVLSPFRISAPVHQKVLRADGWLEYRSDTPASDEFARGYSCAFYTGYTPDGRWRPVETEVRKERTGSPEERCKKRADKPPNRGIVFAAYRLPNSDGTVLASDTTELERLHQDAEMFVEALIDIHMTQLEKDMRAEVQAAQLVRNNSTRKCAPQNQAAPSGTPSSPSPLLAA